VALPGEEALPALPETVPALDTLEEAALVHHPRLAALRASYLVAEKELRLEVADALPDLEMGLDYDNEDGDRTLGLPLGIEIPLFDRNQQGIVSACARRDEIRVRYRAALQRLLSEVATAHARLEARRATRAVLTAAVEPASRRTLETARRGLEAGTLDVLHYLEVLRAERAAALESLDARIAEHEAWLELEQAAGVPLLTFPGQPAAPAAQEESR
jgi:outer membrane protein TolC